MMRFAKKMYLITAYQWDQRSETGSNHLCFKLKIRNFIRERVGKSCVTGFAT